MAKLNHPNLLQVLDSFQSKNYIYLVLEYCDMGNFGSLLDYVKASGVYLQEDFLKNSIYTLCSTLLYLQGNILRTDEQSFVYGRIKPSEILIKDNILKLSEFSPLYTDTTWLFTPGVDSSMKYFPPEMLEGKASFNQKFDVWSVGIILFFNFNIFYIS